MHPLTVAPHEGAAADAGRLRPGLVAQARNVRDRTAATRLVLEMDRINLEYLGLDRKSPGLE
jgi:hypothetical protein